jgi:hypothetical protein
MGNKREINQQRAPYVAGRVGSARVSKKAVADLNPVAAFSA